MELPVEPPGPGQLRVQVRAAGVGSTDRIILAGKYRFAPKIPLVPGYKVAGVTMAIPSAWNYRRSLNSQLPRQNRVCAAIRRAAA